MATLDSSWLGRCRQRSSSIPNMRPVWWLRVRTRMSTKRWSPSCPRRPLRQSWSRRVFRSS